MIIRPFQLNDLNQCATLHMASRRASEEGLIFDCDLERHDLNYFIENWKKWSELSETDIHIAEDDGEILGFIMFGKVRTRPDFDKGIVPKYGSEIYALYVHPDHFRKGIGKALFQRACDDLINRKTKSMILWTKKKNKRSCGFYTVLGGAKVGKKRVDMGDKSWVEESCFAWGDITKI